MAIPPPPGPPKPPPPPAMGGLKLSGGNVPSTDVRSALLQSIQKGTKLKKTTTIDKSGPVTSGKVISETNSSSSSSPPKRKVTSSIQGQPIANGGPKLAGLFEGLSSMPKLKPVNSRDNVPSSKTTTTTSASAPTQELKENRINSNNTNIINNNNNNNNNNNGPMDFNTELTKHLAQTLKRQKQNTLVNATEANLRTNRGPPPKPPIQKNIITTSTSDSVLEKSSNISTSSVSKGISAFNEGKASSPTLSEGSSTSNSTNNNSTKKNTIFSLSIGNSNVNKISTTTTTTNATMSSTKMNKTPSPPPLPTQQNTILPNKSTLFGSNNGNSDSTSSSISHLNHNNYSSNYHTTSSSLSSTTSLATSNNHNHNNKPTVNHGKPNCAPKPPGIQQLVSNSGKPTVSRHHSMKHPRSPPISAITGGSLFSNAQHFGTLRGPPPQFNQSQESIAHSNTTTTTTTTTMSTAFRQAPIPPIGRPTEAPPKPPSTKPAPPPIPARSVSNTNLTNLPLSTVTANSNSNTNSSTTFGSSTNISAIKEQLRNQISYTGSVNNVSSSINTIKSSNLSSNQTEINSTTSNIGRQHSPNHNQQNKDNKLTNLNGISPTIPSHRTQPAPDPPQRQLSNNINLIPPKPPERHSSIRSNSATGLITATTIASTPSPPTTGATIRTNYGGKKKGYNSNSNNSGNSNNYSTGNMVAGISSGIVNRLIVDIEMKYGSRFHNVTEFPTPPPFLNSPKVYPSRNVNNVEIRKPRAPSPPVNRQQEQQQHQQGWNTINYNQMNERKS